MLVFDIVRALREPVMLPRTETLLMAVKHTEEFQLERGLRQLHLTEGVSKRAHAGRMEERYQYHISIGLE